MEPTPTGSPKLIKLLFSQVLILRTSLLCCVCCVCLLYVVDQFGEAGLYILYNEASEELTVLEVVCN